MVFHIRPCMNQGKPIFLIVIIGHININSVINKFELLKEMIEVKTDIFLFQKLR